MACNSGIYVANKHNYAQLTNIHYWDSTAGAWSPNLLNAATPFLLFPNPISAGDVLVFGIDTSVQMHGPFCSLVFDIGTVCTVGTTLTWRYSNAGADPTAWAALGVQDNTNQGGVGGGQVFDTAGINSVHWDQSQYTFAPVNPQVGVGPALGVTGQWVAVHASGIDGSVAPTQQNRGVYTILWPYVDIDADDIAGDLPAIPKITLTNQSDRPTGSYLAHSRVIVGSRSITRNGVNCSDFTPWLLTDDVQLPTGVTRAGPSTLRNEAVTGWASRIGGAGGSLSTWFIDASVAPQWYGRYHAYLLAELDGGTVDDVDLYVNYYPWYYDLNNPIVVGPERFPTGGAEQEFIDMGMVQFIGNRLLLGTEQVDMAINVNCVINDPAVNWVYLYALILMPVDEWAGEFSGEDDQHEQSESVMTLHDYLIIDGCDLPRQPLRAVVFDGGSGEVKVPWTAHATPPRLTPSVAQRLWFLSVQREFSFSAATIGQGLPGLSAAIELSVQQRYSSMRGDS